MTRLGRTMVLNSKRARGSRITRAELAGHVLVALVASGLGYFFAFLLGLSAASLEVAGLVLVVLLPGEFVIITLRTRKTRRERLAAEEALLLGTNSPGRSKTR